MTVLHSGLLQGEHRPLIAAAPRDWSLGRTVLLAGAIVAAIQILLLLTTTNHVLHGLLFDPDCYMHLQRAFRLLTEGGWHEPLDPRINAPYGYSIHWTTLFDALLVFGAAPLRLFGMEPHAALYVWGSLISPLLLVMSLPIFAWGVKSWINGPSFLWLTTLFFTQPQLSGAFLAGRPDHHSLIGGLLLAQIAWLYAYFDGRAGLRWAAIAGALAAVQMCTSIEALLTIFLVCVVLALAWCIYGMDTLRTLTVYLGTCIALIVVWILWERGGSYFLRPFYDRVSIVHVAVLGIGLLGLSSAAVLEKFGLVGRGIAARLISLVVMAVASALAIAAIFPDFFLGPWPHPNPAVVTWEHTIAEAQPLFPTNMFVAAQFLAQFTGCLVAVPFMLNQLRKQASPLRSAMLVSLVGFVFFGPIALAQMRWLVEAQAVMLLPFVLTTQHIMRSPVAISVGKTRLPLRGFALASILLLQTVPPNLAHALSPTRLAANSGQTCSWSQATRFLATLPSQDGIILTDLWYGPEILWRTHFRVVGVPYEMAPAMVDTNKFQSGSEDAVRKIAMERRISYILLCGDYRKGSFSDHLVHEEYPGWLHPLRLPGDLSAFHLYRVTRF